MKKIKIPLPKNKYARIFVKSFMISAGVLASLVLVLFITLNIFYSKIHIKKQALPDNVSSINNNTKSDEIPDPDGDVCKNIVVFGVDQGEARTDTIMLVHFNSQTSQVAVISIPRDTKVEWTPEQQDMAIALGRPYEYYSKITDMSSLGGIDNLRYFTIASIENLLNIHVDNYVIVNTQMLRDLVDKVGGVEVNVPRVMQYQDTHQGLSIDLQPGLQTLNGHQAEGLIRWRHNNDYSEQYAEGDLGRIETQRLFVTAFAKKILSIHSLSKITGILTTAYKNITTDIDFSEALSYVSYLNTLSADNIVFQTLPGEPVKEDRWYYIVDDDEAKSFVSLIFTDATNTESSNATSTDSTQDADSTNNTDTN